MGRCERARRCESGWLAVEAASRYGSEWADMCAGRVRDDPEPIQQDRMVCRTRSGPSCSSARLEITRLVARSLGFTIEGGKITSFREFVVRQVFA